MQTQARRISSSPTHREVASKALLAAAKSGDTINITGSKFAKKTVLHEERYIGRKINGYTIKRELGSGGFGKVFEAVNEETGHELAVKLGEKDLMPEALAILFMKSFSSTAHIVQVYSAGYDKETGNYYLMQEKLDNGLRSELEQGPIHWERAMSITLQLCDVLSEIHDTDLIYRDLKPDNVLLATDEEGKEFVKLVDFGTVRLRQQLVKEGESISVDVAGTYEYMPPEILGGDVADFRSDLFSLGATMYEMVAGVLPFDNDVTVLINNKVVYGFKVITDYICKEIPKPTERNPALRGALPEPLENIIMKLMSKNPEDRFQSTRELAQTIRSTLANLSDRVKNIAEKVTSDIN